MGTGSSSKRRNAGVGTPCDSSSTLVRDLRWQVIRHSGPAPVYGMWNRSYRPATYASWTAWSLKNSIRLKMTWGWKSRMASINVSSFSATLTVRTLKPSHSIASSTASISSCTVDTSVAVFSGSHGRARGP